MDDFEAFRKKQLEQKKASKQADRIAEQNEALGWQDGFGPSGPTNPKVKGFILGRYRTKKVDPATLQRPKGYEQTHLGDEAAEARLIYEKVEAQAAKIMEEAERKIEALYDQAEKLIAKQRTTPGKKPLQGFQRF